MPYNRFHIRRGSEALKVLFNDVSLDKIITQSMLQRDFTRIILEIGTTSKGIFKKYYC